MKKFILLVLLTLGAVSSVLATTVKYVEGYYTVPDYMTEVPADDVRGYDPNPQARSFVGRDANGQVFIVIASYRDTSQICRRENLGRCCFRARAATYPGNSSKLCRGSQCQQGYKNL